MQNVVEYYQYMHKEEPNKVNRFFSNPEEEATYIVVPEFLCTLPLQFGLPHDRPQ
jgi:hypothetical protein